MEIDADGRSFILNKHNELREYVAEGLAHNRHGEQLPPALDMTELVMCIFMFSYTLETVLIAPTIFKLALLKFMFQALNYY